jgi:hypothetical protein
VSVDRARKDECVANPKTGKPYTKHRYRQENLRVEEYKTMRSGEIVPVRYAFELVCGRCGREVSCGY